MQKFLCRFSLSIMLTLLALNLFSVGAGAVSSQLTSDANDQFSPAISGDRIVWLDGLSNVAYAQFSNVYLMTIGGTPQKISTVKKASAPSISASNVIWEDLRNDSSGPETDNSDLYGFALPGGPEAAIDTNGSAQLGPDTSGGRFVWADNRNGNWDIYLKDTNGLVYQITTDPGSQIEPRIDGDLIVWGDDRNGNDDVYLYNIATATETRITDNSAKQNGPDISGRKIVWTDWRTTRNIYVYDLDNPTANGAPVDPSPAVQHSARISGNRVVWTDWRNGTYGSANSDIYGRNLNTGLTTRITSDPNLQNSPDVSGDRVVWADNSSGHWDIYLDMPDTVAPAASVIAPSISTKTSKTPRFKVRWTGSDAAPSSGLAGYDIQRKVGAGGSWAAWKAGTTATEALFKGKVGKTYYFRARATDGAGNVGAWSAEKRTIVPYDDSSRILKSRRGFNGVIKSTRSKNYRSTLRYSTKRGHFLRYRFSGDSVAIIARATNKGAKAKIYIDGKFVKKINTRRLKTQVRKIVYSKALTKKMHTLKIVNLATSKRPRLDIDGIAVGN